jgi:hypothetical protein
MISGDNLDHGDHRGDECGKNGGHQSKAAQRVGAIHGDDADCGEG